MRRLLTLFLLGVVASALVGCASVEDAVMAPLKQVANPTYYAPQPVRPQTVKKTQRKPVVRKAKPVAQQEPIRLPLTIQRDGGGSDGGGGGGGPGGGGWGG
jgi:hypothetical protein